MKSNILFLFATVLLTVISCKKEETLAEVTPPITNLTKDCKITKVVQNQITNGVSAHYKDYDYTYDTSGRLTNEDETCYICSDGLRFKYVYTNDTVKEINKITNKVIKIFVLNGQGYPKYSASHYSTDTTRTYYTYNALGYLIKDSTYSTSPNVTTYEWVDGNNTKQINSGQTTYIDYLADKSAALLPKRDPFGPLEAVKTGKGSKNLRNKIGNGSDSVTYQYQYNADGYVSKVIAPVTATFTDERNFIYTCK